MKAADEVAQKNSQASEANEWRFDINDFPQQVRWKLTHRDTMAQINDFTGAAITTRGSYIMCAPPPLRALFVSLSCQSLSSTTSHGRGSPTWLRVLLTVEGVADR